MEVGESGQVLGIGVVRHTLKGYSNQTWRTIKRRLEIAFALCTTSKSKAGPRSDCITGGCIKFCVHMWVCSWKSAVCHTPNSWLAQRRKLRRMEITFALSASKASRRLYFPTEERINFV